MKAKIYFSTQTHIHYFLCLVRGIQCVSVGLQSIGQTQAVTAERREAQGHSFFNSIVYFFKLPLSLFDPPHPKCFNGSQISFSIAFSSHVCSLSTEFLKYSILKSHRVLLSKSSTGSSHKRQFSPLFPKAELIFESLSPFPRALQIPVFL